MSSKALLVAFYVAAIVTGLVVGSAVFDVLTR